MKIYSGLITKQTLIQCFEEAKKTGAAYVGVMVKRRDSTGPEFIINPAVNYDDKLAYYTVAYNDDLTLKTAPMISIIGFGYSNSFGDLGLLSKY